MIIDAKDLIVGRLGTYAAKQALQGEKVDIVNVELALVSGTRSDVLAKFKQKRGRTTPAKGPFIARMPDRFVRRIIRGMLPYKQEKGRKAFERIMCYIGVPKGFEGKTFQTVDSANAIKRQTKNYVQIVDICRELGAKV
jgi:large subunit ribosomal protein L13